VAKFSQRWQGVDDPTPEPPKEFAEQWRVMCRMFAFLKPIKFQAFVVVIVFIVGIGCEILTVRLLGPAVDVVKEMRAQERPKKDAQEKPPEPATPFGTGEVAPDESPAEPVTRPAAAEPASAQSQSPAEPISLWQWLTQPDGSGAALRRALYFLALAKLAHALLIWVRTVTMSWQNMSMVYYMRASVYDRLQRVGFAFHDRYASGALINRALSDLQAVRHFIQETLHAGVDLIFSTLGYFAIFITTSPQLAAIAAISLPLWIWAIRRFAIRARPIYERQMKASDEVMNVLTENAAGVHVVRAFATEELEERKYRSVCVTLLDRIMDGVGLRQRMLPMIRAIAIATNVTIWTYGAILVQRGELKLGDLVVFGAAMGIILGKMHQINMMADAYQHALVSSGRLFEILDSADTTPEVPDADPLPPGGGAVRFENVTFGYDPARQVIKDISFEVPTGSVVALVGPTGSGKTTLMSLLGRCYDPQKGRILIDGEDVRSCTIQSIRDQVGYVFQETYLFSDTIARNIAYSDLNATPCQIQQAARIAQADEFIKELPKGYDNPIGEYGATLSGGQRQRLAIARAILHNPRLLVLDDSLSAVDPETESQIRAQLEKIMKHRTTFIITSRISTAQRADLILVIEDGCITQRGKHSDLIRRKGYYREMAESQFAEPGRVHEESHMDRVGKGERNPILIRKETADEEDEA
jgi:ATP-binding cassette subfamily B protein